MYQPLKKNDFDNIERTLVDDEIWKITRRNNNVFIKHKQKLLSNSKGTWTGATPSGIIVQVIYI